MSKSQAPSAPRRKYNRTGGPEEFKPEAVKMLVSDQTAAYISKALGVSENLIYRWKIRTAPAARQGVKKSKW